MSNAKELLSAIHDQPLENDARLRYADLLDEDKPSDHAALIRKQVRMDEKPGSDPEYGQHFRGAKALAAALPHPADLFEGLDEPGWKLNHADVSGKSFDRGFPLVSVTRILPRRGSANAQDRVLNALFGANQSRPLNGSDFADHAHIQAMFQIDGMENAMLTGVAIRNEEDVRALLASPYKDRVAGISLSYNINSNAVDEHIEDLLSELLKTTPTIQRLRVNLTGRADDASPNGAAAASLMPVEFIPELSQIRHLEINYNASPQEHGEARRPLFEQIAALPLGPLSSFSFHGGLDDNDLGIMFAVPEMQKMLEPVKTLDLSGNLIGSAGMRDIGNAEFLKNMRSLSVRSNPDLHGMGTQWMRTPNMQKLLSLDVADTKMEIAKFARQLTADTTIMPQLQEAEVFLRALQRNQPARALMAEALVLRDDTRAASNTVV